MRKDITDGLQTIWTAVKGSAWYTRLTLSNPTTMWDLRRKFEYTRPLAPINDYITYANATALIDAALRRGVSNPRLVTAFGEGLRGSVADPMENAYLSVDGLMQRAGWTFNPNVRSHLTGAAISFGALAETGLRPSTAETGECEAAFYALLNVAYAVGGLTYNTDTTQDKDAIYNPGNRTVLTAQRAAMAGAAVRGHPGTGALAGVEGVLAGVAVRGHPGTGALASAIGALAGDAVRGHPGTGGLEAAAGGMAGEGTVTS